MTGSPRPLMRRLAVPLLVLLLVCAAKPASAALELFTDGRSLFFGLMELGDDKTLSESGSYHNEITCASTGGAPWYLKVSLLRPLSSGIHELPLQTFTWQVTRTNGSGSLAHGARGRSFNLAPDLVYISGADEASGTPVSLQFKYSLTIPDAQAAGIYETTIRFTLTEIL